MTQECHVRFCERLKVKFHGPTYLELNFEWRMILGCVVFAELCFVYIFGLR